MDKTHSGMIRFSSEEDNRILPSEGGDEESVDEFGGGRMIFLETVQET
jgi:hypothetical protein